MELVEACLMDGIFYEIWKRQTLVLVPKAGKSLSESSAYKSTCLLDTVGKILERILCNRLLQVVKTLGGLSDRQCGFCTERPTVAAIRRKRVDGPNDCFTASR